MRGDFVMREFVVRHLQGPGELCGHRMLRRRRAVDIDELRRAIVLRVDGVIVTVCIDPGSTADLLTRRLHESAR